ncbi:MAG: hypothetical protein ACXW11_11510 [Methylotenera sp.]
MASDIEKEEIAKNKARIEAINNELKDLDTKLATLNAEKKELIKTVRNAIKADLKSVCEEYGFVIRNKTKTKKKSDTDTEE